MTDSTNNRIELCSNQKLLIRRLYHEDTEYSMAVVEVGQDNRISISPFITETANTIFIDSIMRLITTTADHPYLIAQSEA